MRTYASIFFSAALLSICMVSSVAMALTVEPYSEKAFSEASLGETPVAVEFAASWCGSCVAQGEAIETLKDVPALKQVTLLKVDYDNSDELQKRLKVSRQSTIVVFRNGIEQGRAIGVTDPTELTTLLLKKR